ncbi:CehA/McbA family metallohydrolase [Planotetraspora phitsanulokensis]|uniref:CehA/McbA family metallohydrolase n=1 Tax=Planotetraspora phitsanulokensis TaxID=575192 RepID=UPI00194E2250|nr:CehA/McbA family metallohydrolase [Planotetraspora phitsanulokensis]
MELNRRQFIVAGGTAVAAAGLPVEQAAASAQQTTDHAKKAAPRGEWLAGETHAHDDHSSDGSLPRQTSKQALPGNLPVSDQIAEAERMGLDFLPLTDHRTYDQHWDPQWRSSKLILLPGEEANGSPHATVLGAVDTIVDGANPPGSPAFRHVQQSIWDAHAQDASWGTAHPDDGEYTREAGPNENASAQGVNTVEVWNVASDPDAEIDYAENRWNKGFRFGAVAASDCHFREVWGKASPGQPTTWVFAAERSVRGILDALRAGRTVVSATPQGAFVTIEADVDGDGVFEAVGGDEVIVRDRRLPKKARLRVRIRGGVGTKVHVYASPGRAAGPLATFTPASADQTYLVPFTLDGAHNWFRAEVRAPGDPSGVDADPTLPDQLRAATSPVFVSLNAPAVPAPEIALPPAETRDDHAALALGDTGRFAGFADVAGQGSVAHVVAQVHRDHRTSVVYRRVEPHGNAQHTIELSAGSPTASSPKIAASGDDVWVVWQDSRGQERPHRSQIFLRHSRNGGHSFEPAVRLTDTQGRAIHPAVAVLDGRHAVVAWADNDGGAFDVYAQVIGVDQAPVNLSAPGKAVSAGTATDARSPRHPASLFPAIAAAKDGGLVVTWQDNRFDPDPLWTGHTPPAGQPAGGGTDPDNWQIVASVRPAREKSWSAPVQVSAATDAADRHPGIAVDRDGTVVIMWETKRLQSSGANLSLRASRSFDGGRTWSASEPVGLNPAAMSQRPSLSRDSDGSVRAVWYDTRSADWRWKVFTSRLDRATGWTAPAQLSTLANGAFPSAADGFVVFTSDRGATRTQRDGTQQIFLLRL